MKLPNAQLASVSQRKIAGYLLSRSHNKGRGKALFFASYGFTADAWDVLAEALCAHAIQHEVCKAESSALVL